jgi:single-strand DNA-binding protein
MDFKPQKFSMNNCQFAGNIGRIDEVKEFGSSKVLSFSIAVNKSWKDKQSDEWKEKTTWINCKAWNYAADKVLRMQKGQTIFIQAELEIEEWESEGNKRQKAVFNCREIKALTRPDADSSGGGYSQQTKPSAGEDDLPF